MSPGGDLPALLEGAWEVRWHWGPTHKNCTGIVSAVLTSGLLDMPHHGARQLCACPAGTQLLQCAGAGWLGRVTLGDRAQASLLAGCSAVAHAASGFR